MRQMGFSVTSKNTDSDLGFCLKLTFLLSPGCLVVLFGIVDLLEAVGINPFLE